MYDRRADTYTISEQPETDAGSAQEQAEPAEIPEEVGEEHDAFYVDEDALYA